MGAERDYLTFAAAAGHETRRSGEFLEAVEE
jgi:hypothetical protein